MKNLRPRFAASLAVLLSATAARGGDVGPAARPVAVVELFTSQGCANCPPADAFLGELAREGEVVALSYSVDYWDYMGWKDTAAKPEFTLRQKAYADGRGDHEVFTPQAIVNGRARLIGSDRDAIRREIAAGSGERRDLAVPVEIENAADTMRVRLPDAASLDGAHATVWLVRFDRTRQVAIGHGENTGRTVTYSHVVRALLPIGMWKGRALTIELPRQNVSADSNAGCAVLLQSEKDGVPGRILGARLCS